MARSSTSAVTTADVARAAGVSRGTVSYALNGDPQAPVAPDTRQRVIETAERLGYEPSAAARLLRGGQSRTVLLLSADVDGPGDQLTSFVAELSRALGARGLSLVWQLGVSGIRRPVGELSPALVLTAATADDPEFAHLASGFKVPVLPAFRERDRFIGSAATAQVEHLAARGHSMVYYAAPHQPVLKEMIAVRVGAARAAAARLGIDITVVTWPDDRDGAATVLTELTDGGIAAIAAFNDHTALAVLGAAYDLGLTVPGRVAVIGVDDIPAAATAGPALTSVRSATNDYAELLAAAVQAILRGEAVTLPQLTDRHDLVQRAST